MMLQNKNALIPAAPSRTIAQTAANMAGTMGVQTDEAARSTATNVVRPPPRVEETAATVAWVASD